MNTRLLFAATALAATGIASSASAQTTSTITFAALPLGNFTSATFGDYVISHPVYGQSSVVFTSDKGLKSIGDDQTDAELGTGFTIARVDGAAFNVDAIVFAVLSGSSGVGSDVRVNVDPFGSVHSLQKLTVDQQAYSGPAIKAVTSLLFDAYANVASAGVSSITVTSIPAVAALPEPATWAMMIGGFGIAGAAMRRRRAKTTVRYA